MPLRVNNNIAAINARRHLNANTKFQATRLERLSSGLRVNRAADDAAGLSVREGMRAEVAGLRINVLNSEQATNLIQAQRDQRHPDPHAGTGDAVVELDAQRREP